MEAQSLLSIMFCKMLLERCRHNFIRKYLDRVGITNFEVLVLQRNSIDEFGLIPGANQQRVYFAKVRA